MVPGQGNEQTQRQVVPAIAAATNETQSNRSLLKTRSLTGMKSAWNRTLADRPSSTLTRIDTCSRRTVLQPISSMWIGSCRVATGQYLDPTIPQIDSMPGDRQLARLSCRTLPEKKRPVRDRSPGKRRQTISVMLELKVKVSWQEESAPAGLYSFAIPSASTALSLAILASFLAPL